MSHYYATIRWLRGDQVFSDNQYSRAHDWLFQGEDKNYLTTVPASSSPHIVPLPYSVAENVDPEEAFVAALSSCHMLFFLSIAAKKGWVIDRYIDEAIRVLEQNDDGAIAITQVTLQPHIEYAGTAPNTKETQAIHHQAHQQCFIANSVKTEIKIKSL